MSEQKDTAGRTYNGSSTPSHGERVSAPSNNGTQTGTLVAGAFVPDK